MNKVAAASWGGLILLLGSVWLFATDRSDNGTAVLAAGLFLLGGGVVGSQFKRHERRGPR